MSLLCHILSDLKDWQLKQIAVNKLQNEGFSVKFIYQVCDISDNNSVRAVYMFFKWLPVNQTFFHNKDVHKLIR